MAVLTRWSYKRGGRKAGFHCKKKYRGILLFRFAGTDLVRLCFINCNFVLNF